MNTLISFYVILRLLRYLRDMLLPVFRLAFFAATFIAIHSCAIVLTILSPIVNLTTPRWPRFQSWVMAVALGVWFTVLVNVALSRFFPIRFPWWLCLVFALPGAIITVWELQRVCEARLWARRRGSSVIGNWRAPRYYVNRPFTLPASERLKHLAVQGPTGSGKTTLLKRLIIDDLRAGSGICVIDPKDDLVDSILPFVPASRIQEVVLLDATDAQRPLGFNPLSGVPQERRSLATGEIVAILRRQFKTAWGPRLEHILTHAIMALLEVPGATLLDVHPLLLNPDLRRAVIERVLNPAVRDFFIGEFNDFLQRRGDALEPILNKIGPWRAYPELRGIIGQRQSTFNIRTIMDRGHILLVRIPQGSLGEDVSSLLGSLVVAKLQQAAHSRVELSGNRRRPFFLYVDEFQNFATESFSRILTEARGFGLGLICANQYAEQLPRDLQLSVMHNTATQVACTQLQGRYELRIRRPSDPEDAEPLVVRPPRLLSSGDAAWAARVRQQSRMTYGRPVEGLTIPQPAAHARSTRNRRDASRARASARAIDVDED